MYLHYGTLESYTAWQRTMRTAAPRSRDSSAAAAVENTTIHLARPPTTKQSWSEPDWLPNFGEWCRKVCTRHSFVTPEAWSSTLLTLGHRASLTKPLFNGEYSCVREKRQKSTILIIFYNQSSYFRATRRRERLYLEPKESSKEMRYASCVRYSRLTRLAV